ncbi:hypothetical protein Mp_8g09600 [Marchantia polymorpha subsp. ruderalis]|nr:hypothetical protein MARPO_0008s0264 [Marchantia polymorpha]BBN19313.1 hypothetical protein Mp_8g09600 [Marchantia polymorpha subsp. ruderalis]|eukprot:PTQ47523.1 hypothetical protein MARPO_0008s0264 [Marchantia polymorpha]
MSLGEFQGNSARRHDCAWTRGSIIYLVDHGAVNVSMHSFVYCAACVLVFRTPTRSDSVWPCLQAPYKCHSLSDHFGNPALRSRRRSSPSPFDPLLLRISFLVHRSLPKMGGYTKVWTLLLVLSVAAKATQAQTCSATDQSALLYASREIVLSGKAFMTWLDGTNCCTWEGVTCNSAGRVEALTIVSADVPAPPPTGPTYTICSGLADLNSLRNLTIVNVALNGDLPTTIGGLTNLQVMNIDGCNLVGAVPAEVCKLSGLSTLILKNNLLDSYPDCINSMGSLSTIDLTGNKFGGAPKKP